MPLREKLTRRVAQYQVVLPPAALDAFISYFELLRQWNRKVSLTSLPVDAYGDEAVDRLLIEPLLAGKYLPRGDHRILDVGSGGGSPAIPLKIVSPRSGLLMVESKTRKAAFLREAVRELRLVGASVEAARLEGLLTRPELHGSFDVATMRAVRADLKILGIVRSFLRPDGMLFLFTSLRSADDTPVPGFRRTLRYPLLGEWGTSLSILNRQEP